MVIKNKKGIFFTLIAILILTLLIIGYTFYSSYQKRIVTQNRIETMNDFIFSLEEDLSRKLFTLGYRTIFIFESKIIETGLPINNLDNKFQELFYNGTYNEINEDLMIGATYNDIINDYNLKSSKINVNFNLTNSQITLTQVDPWNILINLNSSLFIEDKNNIATWNISKNFTSLIPLSYFDDPAYLLNSGGIITHKIIQTPYTSFTNNDLLDHTLNSYYINSSESPSFLDRLKGNLEIQNINGIESLVNVQELSNQGLPTPEKSIVDSIYFSTQNPSFCQIPGLPNWFKLDNSALLRYGVSC
jgi:hypothetical protein